MSANAARRFEREALHGIARRLGSIAANDLGLDEASTATPRWLVEDLGKLFRFEHSVSYRPRDRGLADRIVVSATPEVLDRYDVYVRSFPVPYHYNPLRPEASQRNRARTRSDVCTCRGHSDEQPCPGHALFPRVGLRDHDQLRVLVCDGGDLLAWLGGLRTEPFTDRERALLQSLVSPLTRHLALRRRLVDHDVLARGLEAALDAMSAPAYLARRDGSVAYASVSARALYDSGQLGPEVVRAHLAGRATVSPLVVGDGTRGYLVVLEGDPSVLTRVGAAWGVTERERDVLGYLAAGESNKEIALRLAISEVTVERHVTSLLRKARCESRARLIAKFWRMSR